MEEVINGEGKKVCVTGASGFIASWLVKLLLERGYMINATVRSLKDPTKTEHLLGLDGAKKRLHLFEADLLKEGSFDSAIQGCYGVFHTACPVVILPTNPEAEMIDPAVKGTLNVLGSCVKFPSVKRVIYMSSTEAVINNGRPLTNGTIVDETWFSTPEFCKGTDYDAYSISKTIAEATAWKFAKENEIDLVSMNPATVIGPILQPTLNLSSYSILNFINGSNYHPVNTYGYVHVRDVAEAHIKALETPSAKGRYILCETVASNSDIVEILHELYPSLKLPDKGADDLPVQGTYSFSQDKAKSLGIEYTPFKIAVKETVECLKDKFMISV